MLLLRDDWNCLNEAIPMCTYNICQFNKLLFFTINIFHKLLNYFFMFPCNEHVETNKFLFRLACTWMTIIDSQFYIIDSLFWDVSLEWNCLVVKRELTAWLKLCYGCLCFVSCLQGAITMVCLQSVIVAFPDHTHSLFNDNSNIIKHWFCSKLTWKTLAAKWAEGEAHDYCPPPPKQTEI